MFARKTSPISIPIPRIEPERHPNVQNPPETEVNAPLDTHLPEAHGDQDLTRTSAEQLYEKLRLWWPNEEELLIVKSTRKDALVHAIKAAEFYMKAVREAKTPADRLRLQEKLGDVITLGEYLKASSVGQRIPPKQPRETTPRETVILLRSSKLKGNTFLPWKASHSAPEAFQLKASKRLFIDETPLPLSRVQLDNFAGWKRPADMFPPSTSPSSLEASHHPSLEISTGRDLVQDVTADCSVVASLCSAMRLFCRAEGSLLNEIMFPFDSQNNRLVAPENGKYIFRMNFNGCFRRVEIDDRLPASLTDRALFVTDRRNPTVIWPALMEKAYLKIRGGYDFPGSNSCTDLWVLTGWVPQQLFLQRDALNLDLEWNYIAEAFAQGNVIVTLGTGRISSTEEEATGLVGKHDYAVLELDPDPNRRQLLIKNPWRSGETWKELGSTSSAATGDELKTEGPAHLHDQTGTFWMSLADVTQHFESMYLNWNPALFRHRQDHHFVWNLSPRKNMSATIVHNPQYTMVAGENGCVWVLLARHFTDEETTIIRQRPRSSDDMHAENSPMGFISLYVLDSGGKRVQKLSRGVYSGPFVDSPQTLAKFEVEKGKAYTIVPVHDKLPLLSCTFTLSFFANGRLAVGPAEDGMRHYTEVPGAWARNTAGGNSGSTNYGTNPQFSITVAERTPLSLLLSTDHPDTAVHIDLVWADGKRVGPSLAIKDVLADSGAYVPGCALLDVPSVDAGTYTAVCSTFESGQHAEFSLRVGSASPHVVRPVPTEDAGRLRTQLAPFVFAENETRLRARLRVGRLTRMRVYVRSTTAPSAPHEVPRRSSTPLRAAIMSGRGPGEMVLAVSGEGEFTEPTAGLRTPEVDVEVGRAEGEGVWVVVERVGGNRRQETFQVEILGDGPVEVGGWEDVS
ncbi:related to calpain-like protease palBory [Cephalotrichum gorgonifer]|uniref:Related to calpain-like protease palBory n=1 Tax=Cephalotrichum gorgonifer TaxID=2041049 RepID=A0AAE8N0C9_9PEZI|nr:related to calpain-like protease palBory [Cephalotrichum gorgonifer]